VGARVLRYSIERFALIAENTRLNYTLGILRFASIENPELIERIRAPLGAPA